MAGLAPYLADPVIARQVTSTLARIVTQQAVLGTAAYLGTKRLRSESSNMPLFGPSKKAKSEVARRTRNVRARMSRQLQFKGVHVFSRTVGVSFTYSSLNGMQTGANTLTKGQAIYFSLGVVTIAGSGTVAVGIPGATDLQGLFDAWRIKRCKVQLLCTNNSSSVGSLANGMPIICTAVDANDGAVPTSRDELTQDSTFRVDRLDDSHLFSRSFQPHTVTAATAQECPLSTWIPTSNPNQSYFGMKMYCEPVGTTATATSNMFMYITVVYECKDYN